MTQKKVEMAKECLLDVLKQLALEPQPAGYIYNQAILHANVKYPGLRMPGTQTHLLLKLIQDGNNIERLGAGKRTLRFVPPAVPMNGNGNAHDLLLKIGEIVADYLNAVNANA